MSGGPQVFLGATTFLSDCVCLIASPPDLRPPRGLPAREARRPHFVRRRASKPGQAPPPPTGTAARPRRPRGGLQSGGAGNDPAAREARRPHFVRRRASKPARALRSLRRPPHLWGLVCGWVRRLGVRPDPAGLASAFTHVAAELPQCRMQFPHDSFGP